MIPLRRPPETDVTLPQRTETTRAPRAEPTHEWRSDESGQPARLRGRCVELARARWPERGDPSTPPAIAGFVNSSFSPLVAATAERCLRRAADPLPAGTAVVLVTGSGDVASAVQVARAVDAGTRVGPLLFFQSVPNAVAGHIAARHGLDGPVVCLSPAADPLADGISAAELLFADGDAAAALVVCAEQAPDHAYAVLVAPIHEGSEGGST